MLLPAAVDKLLGEAGRLAPYHCWHTLHLEQRWFWLFKEVKMCLVDWRSRKPRTWTRMCSLLGWFMSPNCCHLQWQLLSSLAVIWIFFRLILFTILAWATFLCWSLAAEHRQSPQAGRLGHQLPSAHHPRVIATFKAQLYLWRFSFFSPDTDIPRHSYNYRIPELQEFLTHLSSCNQDTSLVEHACVQQSGRIHIVQPT